MNATQRVALVTGANKGIGREIARQLARAGISVIIGARDLGRAQVAVDDLASHGLRVESLRIDLNDAVSIQSAAEFIQANYGRLDILVNNAGIVDTHDGPPSTAAPEAVRRIIETNFVGTLQVTQAMLPMLRQSVAGRIVNVSSSLGSLTLNGDPTSKFYAVRLTGYNASKAALNMLTVLLAEELRGTSIVVNSISPRSCENGSERASGRNRSGRGRDVAGRVRASW
ncbi:SDR family NAD(P)-dependent oxidoreductase [Luteimonas sp. S4-F44]|uniref:SDR family NAD(P)-dependent oxidoreductase n=1 Tax=Luteimonas sp. S4-F44 TaxID=2925842 RepID=UPI001F53556D|nr:SDR family NAD(P)-dependent oxidoreductase [Luteimonas sp. S4-F44]UNK42709.1 SDR family NAD(P)-dependent oxidoreductase [Luteimonas sp. S4-F44]